MYLYKTIKNSVEVEQVIDKSRFITNVARVETKEEADEFIASIKKKYKDATHNVPAMVIGEKYEIQWCSDDGEPQGTSGAPMLQMIVKEEITNIAVVVTRYFGGIKLGTGGLVRAYTSSAKIGIEEAGLCSVKNMKCLSYKMGYTYQSKLENTASREEFTIENINYGAEITVEIAVDLEKEEKIRQIIENLTNGSAILIEENIKKVETN